MLTEDCLKIQGIIAKALFEAELLPSSKCADASVKIFDYLEKIGFEVSKKESNVLQDA